MEKDKELIASIKKLYEEAIPWMQKLRADKEALEKQIEEFLKKSVVEG